MHRRTVNPVVCKLIPLIASDKTSWSRIALTEQNGRNLSTLLSLWLTSWFELTLNIPLFCTLPDLAISTRVRKFKKFSANVKLFIQLNRFLLHFTIPGISIYLQTQTHIRTCNNPRISVNIEINTNEDENLKHRDSKIAMLDTLSRNFTKMLLKSEL